jgi:integrase
MQIESIFLALHGAICGASSPYDARVAGAGARRRRRARGRIEELPSGSLRVSVYAGIDPVTKRRHYLREVVPAGPRAAAEAEKVARRLAGQVDERRHPRTTATVDQMLDRHFELATLERSTLATYVGKPTSTSAR